MLRVDLAEKFIDKLVSYTNYNVNIMNEKGIIIASRDKSRTGTFHEIAYDIVNRKKDIVEVFNDDEYLGTYSGVNLAIVHNGEWIGAIGITGNPVSVRPMALILKMSIETMIEYEAEKESAFLRKGLKENFMVMLLYSPDIQLAQLEEMAKKIGYRPDILRLPILCDLDYEYEPEEVIEQLKRSEFHSKQDISLITRDNQVVIFKSFKGNLFDLMNDYKFLIGEYLSDFMRSLLSSNRSYKYYVGSFQNNLINYQNSFHHCQWLVGNIDKDSRGVFFYDYIDQYIKHNIPLKTLHKIYSVFSDEMDQENSEKYKDIIGGLIDNDYNLANASKDMYVHRNTLSFRLDKIKQMFNMNPVQNFKDRGFMDYYYYYLNRK